MSSAHENIHDEINEQKKKFRDMTPKQKWGYFWDYYKIPAFVAVFVLFFAVTFGRDYMEARKETLLYAALIGSNTMTDTEQLSEAFAAYAGIDLGENHVVFDSSIQPSASNYNMNIAATQKMMALVSAGILDAALTTEELFAPYTDAGYFADLRTVLSAEQLAAYEDSLYYYTYDPEAARKKAEASGAEYTESTGPYNTLEPVPVGIRLTKLHNLPEDTFPPADEYILGFCVNSTHTEGAVSLLQFLEGSKAQQES